MCFTFDTYGICKNILLLASSLNFQFLPVQFIKHTVLKLRAKIDKDSIYNPEKLSLESAWITKLDERYLGLCFKVNREYFRICILNNSFHKDTPTVILLEEKTEHSCS